MTLICPSPALDPIDVFRLRCEAQATLYRHGEIELCDAVDGLQAIAEDELLVFDPGQDAVQEIIAGAFDRYDLGQGRMKIQQGPRLVQSLDANEKKSNGQGQPSQPLPWLDMSSWDQEPIPERKWAIRDRVPLKQAGLFSGEGGAGKSIVELTKDVAHVTGKDWFGSMPEPGPAMYVGAEDDEIEIHIRLANIAGHYGVTFEQLIAGGLHVLCLLGQDATLCAASGKAGKVEVTAFYRQLYEAAGDIKPKNISIDTLSRAFAGNEIDRVQVYAFAMHMQALAMVANGSVTVLSHPSLQGISSGSGISGSTAWHGAFRFRQYLRGVKPEDAEQPDNNLRELAFMKIQYGPPCEAITLRWSNGLFLPESGTGTLDKMAAEKSSVPETTRQVHRPRPQRIPPPDRQRICARDVRPRPRGEDSECAEGAGRCHGKAVRRWPDQGRELRTAVTALL
jgi:hypothetical protein